MKKKGKLEKFYRNSTYPVHTPRSEAVNCARCKGARRITRPTKIEMPEDMKPTIWCPDCNGKGFLLARQTNE